MSDIREIPRRSGTRVWCAWLCNVAICVAFVPYLFVSLAGCGEDSSPPPPPPKPKSNARKSARRGAAKPKQELQFYKKVEEFAAGDEEKKRLRHEFDPLDFEPDITGLENRDPFRSYVIRQPGEGPQNSTQAPSSNLSDECDNKNHVAPAYPLRDLRLVGIVLRGTRSYALFRDSASYGHIVRKGDCLGQEKAKVASIRTGFVNLQVVAESAPNQPEKAPQERAIQLYPDELLPDTVP